MREHVRQELRVHLLDALERHRAVGLSDEEALIKAIEEFGRPEDLRSELVATHGHRMLAVVVERALHWKEKTMRARWLWLSWANLTLGLVVVLELLFLFFNTYFIFPKFRAMMAYGLIDVDILQRAGASWMTTFLDRLQWMQERHGWTIVLGLVMAIGLFEWRVRGENKSLMRFSALGTTALGLFLTIVVMSFSLVVSMCLALPELGTMVRPWAVEQVARLDSALDALEQAQTRQDWEAMRDPAELASNATDRLLQGPALASLVTWNTSPSLHDLQDTLQSANTNLQDAEAAIRVKDEAQLRNALRALRKSCEPLHEVSKRVPPAERIRRRG